MKLIKASYKIETPLDRDYILKHIERCGRTAYKSEDKITEDSASKFVRGIIKRGHESVIEHYSFTVRFINDRGVSHEEVRHRLCAFTQESTRYCNYHRNHQVDIEEIDNCDKGLNIIDISQHLKNPLVSFDIWFNHMKACENAYNQLIEAGEAPQIARSVLPNSLKTELVLTCNLREWRWIFIKRTEKGVAHPQIIEVMLPLLNELKIILPEVFEGIN
jgi:thymidylate synthase (FAD)